MKKNTLRRILLGLLQHVIAMGIFVELATILFNSYLTVQTMDGQKTYALAPLESETEFEDSKLFEDIFRTSVADLTRLVVIKEQLETNGEFRSSKLIDVTEYAGRKGAENNCPVTMLYELEDLIKWGKYGIEYTDRAMSMSDFVNYFGPALSVQNFRVTPEGELVFIGFYDEQFSPAIRRYYSRSSSAAGEERQPAVEPLKEKEAEVVSNAMKLYTDAQLEDMAFSYILGAIPDGWVEVAREDDGSLTVYFSMLNGRYETTDKEKRIASYAGNWIEYVQLQSNIIETINGLATSYTMYQNCNSIYQTNSNLKYVVRIVTDDGIVKTYTNQDELGDLPDAAITDYFSEYRRYLIYYPDSLEFSGNVSLSEEDIHGYLNEYDYAYPEKTHIWIGVDTSYEIPGDAFYSAHVLFEKIVPKIVQIIAFIGVLVGIWILITTYLTVTAGVAYDNEGNLCHYSNFWDKIWTELFALGWIGVWFGIQYGAQYLQNVANTVYENHTWNSLGVIEAQTYEYSVFAAAGGILSFVLCTLWYSLVRRAKTGILWTGSLIYWILFTLRRGIQFVLTHHNVAISTLIPYNLFLMVNVGGVLGCVRLWYMQRLWSYGLIVLLILLDGLVGLYLFIHNGEWIDIATAIERIRSGEVDYKMDTTHMHGSNKKMAEGVNNIGDGISKAVNTSMKDEQMKTDLITNVSHDIKTPLTSIISYVDLLKRLDIRDEPARDYIEVLDSKSQRLKQLTDDLVEASKLSSGNIEFQMERLNLTELINQAIGELSESMSDKGLQIIFEDKNEPAYIYADSRRMWRVMENLFNNVYKYAMENTRVYIDLEREEQEKGTVVVTSIKNISERQMNIKANDLTERFIRGDSSRTTEGSGLGLYITKNLINGQNGEFDIRLDGDLFKAVMKFPEYVKPEETTKEAAQAENM
ncbi:MAG: HAMP domain-containing histidine kinase [Lachnospiraceae bacterium]|nr:HAMP domain-containing histidine kinase [Lachnospiraceae bacterium]